jgi:hypothetical protein
VGLHRGIDGSEPVRAQPVTRLGRVDADPRAGRVQSLGTGTLACPDCDVPVLIAGTLRPHDPLGCGYCGRSGALRDFLSLAAPTRPARVEIRLTLRAPGRTGSP